MAGKKPDFSPSIVHRRLVTNAARKLAYDGGDVATWQRKARRKLRSLLGVASNEGSPLRPRRLWKRNTDLGTIEKIIFTSEPGADVPAYWCVPAGVEPPYRTFICLQGHSSGMHNSIAVSADDEKTPIDVPGDRDFAIGAMRHGLAALCIEQRAFGEREERDLPGRGEDRCHDAAMHAIMLGRTLVGERVLDVDRAIDYLASRGDVDTKRLGLTGNSGGGTVTIYASALLPRVKLAMPSCSLATYESSILSVFHCSCNYVPGILDWLDMGDVMGCFAPKPAIVVTGLTDEIFPIAGVRRAVRDARKVYKAAGAEKNITLLVGPQGHRFYGDLAWPAAVSAMELM
jgi:dienelactone hydrolase